jgi:hypothetical protein
MGLSMSGDRADPRVNASVEARREGARCLLSIPKGAAAIGLTALALRREIASGDGPPTVRIGKRDLVDLRDLDAWIDRRRECRDQRHNSIVQSDVQSDATP